EGGVPDEAVGGEHLIPVVRDAAARPPVAAPRDEAARVGVRRREEGLGGGGAPVDEERHPVDAGESHAADVEGLRAVSGDDAPEAQIQAVAGERAQTGGEAVDLEVTVEGLLAAPAGEAAGGGELVLDRRDGVGEGRGK